MKEIKKLRQEKGVTQKEMAEVVGVHVRQYQKWEYGLVDCPHKKYLKMESYLEGK